MNLSREQFHGQGELFPDPNHDPHVIHMGRLERPRPPEGYYEGQENRGAQLSLPGMEMNLQDHVNALSKATGGKASLQFNRDSLRPERGVHVLSVRHKKGKSSHLTWSSHGGPGEPGEIQWVESPHPGVAHLMLATAEALAREFPGNFTTPKHSRHRTPEGFKWSRRMMGQRGEEIW